MKASEMIAQLQGLIAEHGDLPVLEYVDGYDGCGDFYTSANMPEVTEDGWYIDDTSDVPHNGWLGQNTEDVQKSDNKITFKKAISI